MRKTPTNHVVRAHLRKGKPVRSFTRGYGSHTQSVRRPRVVTRQTTMISEEGAKQMVAELSGLRRWKDEKSGFGTIVCDDEDDHWYFQIPTNLRAYDVDSKTVETVSATGSIDKRTGEIYLLVPIHANGSYYYDKEDVPSRHNLVTGDMDRNDPEIYSGISLAQARYYLGWTKTIERGEVVVAT